MKKLAEQNAVPWLPRKIKTLRSYWAFPIQVPAAASERGQACHLFTAKRAGEEVLQPIPLERFAIRIKGMPERVPLTDWIKR